MKISFSLKLLTAAALALLLMPPAVAASGGPDSTSTQPFTPVEPPSNIYNGPCSWCNSNSACSSPCIEDDGSDSTCGDYGVCNWCGTAIVEIGRDWIGQRAKEKFWGVCEFKRYYNVTYKSLNAGCQPFTQCEVETTTRLYWIDVYCCDKYGGCFGQTCG